MLRDCDADRTGLALEAGDAFQGLSSMRPAYSATVECLSQEDG
jgi:hypothetical protein